MIALREIDPAGLKELERAEREEAQFRWEATRLPAQQQRPAQLRQIEQVIATLVEESMSSNPFRSIRIGKTPDEVARQYIEAFKARDVTTLVALNHRGALEDIAQVKADYYPASWKHHLEKWARGYLMSFLTRLDLYEVWHEENWTQRDMKSILAVYNLKPIKIIKFVGYERSCRVGNMEGCWDSPKFVAVGSLTYEIEIQNIKKLGGNVIEVPVHVRYPPSSLIINEGGHEKYIHEARIKFKIDVSNNWIVEFSGYDLP